jgi:hypothetical protein
MSDCASGEHLSDAGKASLTSEATPPAVAEDYESGSKAPAPTTSCLNSLFGSDASSAINEKFVPLADSGSIPEFSRL